MENSDQINIMESFKKEIDALKETIKINRKVADDKIEDIREMREADTLIHNIREIGENLDVYLSEIEKVKKSMREIINMRIEDKELHEIWKKSGATLKEIAAYLNLDQINLSLTSRLMNGQINDGLRRCLAYNYCLMKLNKQINTELLV
jgi:hypothetical protein